MGQGQAAQTYAIVCLEHQGNCLYAEVIQRVTERQRSWLRPLALVLLERDEKDHSEETKRVYDLRNCSDLLWPQEQFRAACDVELLPMLTLLQTDKPVSASMSHQEANQQLHVFLRCLSLSSRESLAAE